ncbi:Conserved hypothetical protein (luciferase-like) [Mycobacteroides abscessus]|nr:Conserved hypothetical protein (luciferase-like) [Mycobacteroides abscessus]
MDIGIALPFMCRDYTRESTITWARLADEGPFSTISSGERISYHNQDMWVTLAAAAAVTERVRILANVSVLPAHPVPLVAKQAATLDVLSEGRFILGVGVGGREHDYRCLDASFGRRHQRLDDQVAELRRLWRGEPPFEGADPVGPAPVQDGGPPVVAAAIGPKSLARAARWADGITGFSVPGAPAELAYSADAARAAWQAAGHAEPPMLSSGCFYTLGIPGAESELKQFTREYLAIFGTQIAENVPKTLTNFDADALNRTLDGAEEAGLDEFILVPGASDVAVIEATIELIQRR